MKIYRFEKYDVAKGVSLTKHGILDERIGQIYEIKDEEEFALVKRIFKENCVDNLTDWDLHKNEKVKEVLEILSDADIISFRCPFRQKNSYNQKIELQLWRLLLYIFWISHLAFTPLFLYYIIMQFSLAQIFFYCEVLILLIFLHECCHLAAYKILCKNNNFFFSLSFFRIQLVTAPTDSTKSFWISISGAGGTILVCVLCLLVYFDWALLLAIILNGLMLLPVFDDGKNMVNALREMKRMHY